MVGLLHDIDYEMYPDEHCKKAPELLKEINASEDLVHAICSHGYGICSSVEPKLEMEKILFATDELTGLIWAAAKMRPSQNNGMIKIITGLRRSGKSYLLYNLFRKYLLENVTDENHIIYLALDAEENKKYWDSSVLNDYLLSKIENEKEKYYILLDEIQKVEEFVPVLNGFLYRENVDVYVTGSNSKMLSSDISTEFRGRGDVVHLYPLTFKEYLEAYNGDKDEAWNDYVLYGGLPYTLLCKTDEDKAEYLKNLYKETYLDDIKERRNIKNEQLLNDILDVLSSQIGSLTNPTRLTNIINDRYLQESKNKSEDLVNKNTIDSYIEYIEDSFLINKAQRYDIKGNHYINSPGNYDLRYDIEKMSA